MQKVLGIFIFLFNVGFLVSAQSPSFHELTELVKASFAYAPKMAEQRNAELLAEDRMRLTSLNVRPELSADMSYAYVMPRIEWPINGQKVQFAPVNSVNGSISSSYVIADFGRQKAALDRARNEILIAQHTKEAVALNLAYQVASIYYRIIYLRKGISIQDTLIRVLNEALRIAETQYQNGTALEVDVLGMRSNILTEENSKTELASQLHKQEFLLNYATGQSLKTEGDLRWEQPLIKPTTDTSNQDIQLQNDKWKQAKLDLAAVQLKSRPIVALRGMMGARNGYIPAVNDLRFNYLAGVGLSLPLFTNGKSRQQIRIQERVATGQELTLQSMKKELERDLLIAEDELRSAQEKINRAPAQIELAQRVLEISRVKFRNGTGLYLEILSAENGLQKALWNQLQARYQACLMNLEIAKLRGSRFWE